MIIIIGRILVFPALVEEVDSILLDFSFELSN
ncbi:MAG: hypothetical protein ACI94Y_002946 [Maribacter sp.]|jgi:hypothetical protein